MPIEEMVQGKIYYISFGGTELIGRYRRSDTCNRWFEAYLHYWAGFEAFHKGPYCVKSGIEEIRRATQAEKMALLRFEIEHQTI